MEKTGEVIENIEMIRWCRAIASISSECRGPCSLSNSFENSTIAANMRPSDGSDGARSGWNLQGSSRPRTIRLARPITTLYV